MRGQIRAFNQRLDHWLGSFHAVFWSVVGITSVRVFIEWAFFVFPVQLNGFQDYVRFYLENIYYFLILFLVVSVFVAEITRQPLKPVMRFGVKLYPIIWLPPLIDRLFLGRTEGYYYARAEHFFSNLFTFSLGTPDASWGLSLEVILGVVALFLYVFWKTRHLFKALITGVFLEVFLMVFTTPDLFWGRAGADYVFDVFLPVNYFLPFMVLLAATLYYYNQPKLLAICRNLRPMRSLIFVTAVGLGALATYQFGGRMYWFNVVLSGCAVFFVWQLAIVLNDIYDMEIDQVANRQRPLVTEAVTVREYFFLASLLTFFALSFAVVVSRGVFLLMVVCVGLAFLYSVPPARLRNHIGGNLLIALAIWLSFLMGAWAAGGPGFNFVYLFPVGFLMFLFSTVLTLAKDIKDIDGDRRAGVRNLFTMYGKADAKKIITALIFFVLNIPLLVYFHLSIFVISLIAALVYYRWESIIGVYVSGVTIIVILFYQMEHILRQFL
jgi:4-hydroxybenzoate polyprenyltransferase